MECQMTCQMTFFCAVSLSGTTTAVVDCGKPSDHAIFFLPKPAVAIFRWQRDPVRTGPFSLRKCPQTLKNVETNVTVVHGSGAMCVGVKCAKTCCFIPHFTADVFFNKRGPKQT